MKKLAKILFPKTFQGIERENEVMAMNLNILARDLDNAVAETAEIVRVLNFCTVEADAEAVEQTSTFCAESATNTERYSNARRHYDKLHDNIETIQGFMHKDFIKKAQKEAFVQKSKGEEDA